MDLLSNSLDACEDMDYPENVRPEVAVRIEPADCCFVVSVRDNGCGMPADVKRDIFTPLFTTKEKRGTGLGLALTARTIRQHEGEIEVESEVNAGSEFRIRLPVAGPVPRGKSEAASESQAVPS
jgi:signal transduction histidine kinase